MTEVLVDIVVLYTNEAGKPRSKSFRRHSDAAKFIAATPSAYEKHTKQTTIELLTLVAATPAE